MAYDPERVFHQPGHSVTPILRIQLLGEFCMIYGDTRVAAINSPRLRTLLAYLILHRNAPQPRQHLAFLLWPDSAEEQARTNLRNLLHLLRQSLPHSDCCLRSEGQVLVWQPHVAYTLDIADFEAAIKAGELERAIELYRGDLLPECYGDWIEPERERLRWLYLSALEQLVQKSEDAHDYPVALNLAQRLAQTDPLCEEHCRCLIRLQMLTGDRAAALRTYHTLATTLRRDFGIEPALATQRIYTQALNGGASSTQLQDLAEAELPLIGRRQEWGELLRIWGDAARGRPQLTLITGDAGIGKTRFAEELLGWTAQQGFPTARANCYAAEGSLPFDPIISWLRSRPLPVLPGPWRCEITRLLSDAPGGRCNAGMPWDRHHLFEALAQVVFAWGQPRGKARANTPQAEALPVLLVLDDLQWCDHDTLDWLHFLLRFDPHGRILIVGTAQLGFADTKQPLFPLLSSLRCQDMLAEIELGPLSSSETLALANRVADRPLDPALAEPLHRGSEGNPLFVVEMMRAGRYREEPFDFRRSEMALQSSQSLPPKIQQVLRARLAQLSAPARELAELAAASGRACRYATLVRAYEDAEVTLVQALDELCHRRILRELPEDSYDFAHEKLREVCWEEMSAARRRLVQQRLADAQAIVL